MTVFEAKMGEKETYTGVCGFFLQVKFATSLLASLTGDKYKNFH